MKTRALLATVAAAEILAGCGLLVFPSTAARLLIGQPLAEGAGLVVGRVAGAAMISLGIICWLQRIGDRPAHAAGLLSGLLFYNVAVPLVLLHGHFAHGMNGAGLWAAAAVHLVFAGCIAALLFGRSPARTL